MLKFKENVVSVSKLGAKQKRSEGRMSDLARRLAEQGLYNHCRPHPTNCEFEEDNM